MDTTKEKARFSLLMKQHNNPRWRNAVCWLFHCEEELEVLVRFKLSLVEFEAAKEADDILYRVMADHDRVYEWSKRLGEGA